MRTIINKKNKRGQVIGIILFALVLLSVLVIGFIAVMGTSIFDIASDAITPVMEGLGTVDVNTQTGAQVNLSQAGQVTFGTVDTLVQALPWLIGFLFVGALIFSVIFAVSYSYNPHPAYIGFYFLLVILLIFAGIILSNMYQDIYTANDELSSRLHEQTISSYLLLHSPWIIAVIALITGIYLFSRSPEMSSGQGGFGV